MRYQLGYSNKLNLCSLLFSRNARTVVCGILGKIIFCLIIINLPIESLITQIFVVTEKRARFLIQYFVSKNSALYQ